MAVLNVDNFPSVSFDIQDVRFCLFRLVQCREMDQPGVDSRQRSDARLRFSKECVVDRSRNSINGVKESFRKKLIVEFKE